ncbi:MAG: DUF1844 domain-containing protein [Candidatus Aminicenantes bacterium]|nr:MAG: DUF1844 domain-containing protein [Candidatus Aminicenantes bacterium]
MPEKKEAKKKKATKKTEEKIEEKTKKKTEERIEEKTEEKKSEEKTEEKKTEGAQEILPPLDFSSLILPFYTQALIKLGLVTDPFSDKEGENLELAKRLIDLLDLFKDKTEGNLKSEEEKFLVACIHQLKMAYMEKAKVIK